MHSQSKLHCDTDTNTQTSFFPIGHYCTGKVSFSSNAVSFSSIEGNWNYKISVQFPSWYTVCHYKGWRILVLLWTHRFLRYMNNLKTIKTSLSVLHHWTSSGPPIPTNPPYTSSSKSSRLAEWGGDEAACFIALSLTYLAKVASEASFFSLKERYSRPVAVITDLRY